MSPFLEAQTPVEQDTGVSEDLLAEIKRNNAETISALKEKLQPLSAAGDEEQDPSGNGTSDDDDDDSESLLTSPSRRDQLTKIVFSLPEKLDLSHIDQKLRDILFELFIKSEESLLSEIIRRLPDKLDYSKIGEGGYDLLRMLIERGYISDLFDRLFAPEKLDLSQMRRAEGEFFTKLLGYGFTDELIALLPPVLDVSSMTNAAGDFLDSIVSFLDGHYAQDILGKIPQKLSFSEVNTIARALEQLVQKGYSQEVFEKLPEQIDLVSMSMTTRHLLADLLKTHASDIISKLPTDVDFSQLGLEGGLLVEDILIQEKTAYVGEFISKLPDTIQFSQLSDGSARLLRLLLYGHVLPENRKIEIGTKIEIDTIDFSNISFYSSLLLQEVLKFYQTYQGSQGPKHEGFWRDFEKFTKTLRRAIPPAELDSTNGEAGKSLADIINGFPLDLSSVKKLKYDWIRVELKKTGSRSFVYIRMNEGDLRVLFRNQDISQESLQSYQKAAEMIPEYVSASTYPELMDEDYANEANARTHIPYKLGAEEDRWQKSAEHFRIVTRLMGKTTGGFREVFAGPALVQIDVEKLPHAVKKSIEMQTNYIRFMLGFARIEHGHDHTGNFNVRFLLEDEKGQKILSFDVNKALTMAREHNLSLTPIVTLRDWDQASS